MTPTDFFLLCFAVGLLWTLVSLLAGSLHGGGHSGTAHLHFGHSAGGQTASGMQTAAAARLGRTWPHGAVFGWFGSLLNPSCIAVFLAWFGGLGYLLSRHSGWALWADFSAAAVMAIGAAGLLAVFLQFLQAHEKPMDAADYGMVGVLGRVTSTIRPDGVGELVYLRDGARRPSPARSEDGALIERGREVIVTRYEKGTAYVRTWEAMTQRTPAVAHPE